MESTWRLKIAIPRAVPVGEGRSLERDDFYGWLWEEFQEDFGLVGVHEGTLLAEEAHEQGFETESFTVDAGEAPRERDWIGSQGMAEAELYFSAGDLAMKALEKLRGIAGLQLPEAPEEVVAQDWDAEWKKSFQGIDLLPWWRVLPPWVEAQPSAAGAFPRILRLNPGAGFGTGTHETTQLCLEALAEIASTRPGGLVGTRALDFGSGSGILSIGAALLGAQVDACEIDPLANENARENACLNSIEGRIRITEKLSTCHGPYPLVVANILKPVLLEFCGELVGRLPETARTGSTGQAWVVLSGLVDADVEPVSAAFAAQLAGRRPEVRARGEWRALIWRL
jgi:ribosomal protein L11 methyltransferase